MVAAAVTDSYKNIGYSKFSSKVVTNHREHRSHHKETMLSATFRLSIPLYEVGYRLQ